MKPIPGGNLIGLTLFCIPDIAAGTVELNRVIKVYSEDPSDDWEWVIVHYKRICWKFLCRDKSITPKDCESVFRKLLALGKIIAPPTSNICHTPMIDEGFWVNDETQVRWADEVPED